jgi:hypothetical protein
MLKAVGCPNGDGDGTSSTAIRLPSLAGDDLGEVYIRADGKKVRRVRREQGQEEINARPDGKRVRRIRRASPTTEAASKRLCPDTVASATAASSTSGLVKTEQMVVSDATTAAAATESMAPTKCHSSPPPRKEQEAKWQAWTDKRARILNSLPTHYSAQFGQIGFYPFRQVLWPVLILNPLDVSSWSTCEEWLAMYYKVSCLWTICLETQLPYQPILVSYAKH